MRTMTRILVLAMVGFFLMAGSAMALSFGDGGVSLQGVIDGITVDGDSSVDVTTDYLDDSMDSLWQLTGTGGSVATIIIELASFADVNSFGVYNGSSMVELFSGADTSVDQVTFSLLENITTGQFFPEVDTTPTGAIWDNQYFGYYLISPQGTFYSDTSKNADGVDHMAAYQGTGDTVQIVNPDTGFARPQGTWTPNEYILAWEDLYNGGDRDYTDFVVMVESVEPVPEPATILLLGAGLVGLGYFGRKKKLV